MKYNIQNQVWIKLAQKAQSKWLLQHCQLGALNLMGQLLKYHGTSVDLGEVFDHNLAVDSLICLLSFYCTLKSYLKLLPTTTKSRNFLFSQAYIFSFGTWIAEKGALGNDPHLLH